MMPVLPLIAIIGRPNVGKSTLFNRIVGGRGALTHGSPGVTRDLNYAEAFWDGFSFCLVDTGGLEFDAKKSLDKDVSSHVLRAVDEVDCLLLLMDGRAGVTALDRDWVKKLRRLAKPKIYAINKMDNEGMLPSLVDFYELGISDPLPISAETGRGIGELLDGIKSIFPKKGTTPNSVHGRSKVSYSMTGEKEDLPFRIVIIGRPNAGKSTLLNRLVGAPRALVHEEPGTTRDPVRSFVTFQGHNFNLIDTAGIRRRGRVDHTLEKFSIVKALDAIALSDLCLLVVDATEGISAQDLHVAGEVYKRGRALVILVNKWDVADRKMDERAWRDEIKRRFPHVESTPVLYISAKTGRNVGGILRLVLVLEKQLMRRVAESEFKEALVQIVDRQPPSVFRGKNIRIFGGHQVAIRPPTFVIDSDQPSHIHFSYGRYLNKSIREAFGFRDIPITIRFRRPHWSK